MFKRGFFSDPIALVSLALVLVLFSYIFFVVDIASGNDLTLEVRGHFTQSSSLLVLLRTPVQVDLNKGGIAEEVLIGDLLAGKFKNEPSHIDEETRKVVLDVLAKMPKPVTKGESGWNLEAKSAAEEVLKSEAVIVTLNRGERRLVQSVMLPTRDPSAPLIVTLYLACEKCEGGLL